MVYYYFTALRSVLYGSSNTCRPHAVYVIPAAEFVRRGHVQHKRREGQNVGQLSYLILDSEL